MTWKGERMPSTWQTRPMSRKPDRFSRSSNRFRPCKSNWQHGLREWVRRAFGRRPLRWCDGGCSVAAIRALGWAFRTKLVRRASVAARQARRAFCWAKRASAWQTSWTIACNAHSAQCAGLCGLQRVCSLQSLVQLDERWCNHVTDFTTCLGCRAGTLCLTPSAADLDGWFITVMRQNAIGKLRPEY